MVTTGLSNDSYHFIPAARHARAMALGESSLVQFCLKRCKTLEILYMGETTCCVWNCLADSHTHKAPLFSRRQRRDSGAQVLFNPKL